MWRQGKGTEALKGRGRRREQERRWRGRRSWGRCKVRLRCRDCEGEGRKGLEQIQAVEERECLVKTVEHRLMTSVSVGPCLSCFCSCSYWLQSLAESSPQFLFPKPTWLGGNHIGPSCPRAGSFSCTLLGLVGAERRWGLQLGPILSSFLLPVQRYLLMFLPCNHQRRPAHNAMQHTVLGMQQSKRIGKAWSWFICRFVSSHSSYRLVTI